MIQTKEYLALVESELRNFDKFDYIEGNGISEIIQVWYCKTIQNHKGLFIVKDIYGEIYDYFIEATYNGDAKELYLDFYKKDSKVKITL